jgi:hypothetical protein
MDDFFRGFQGFDDLYEFLRDHFLPRIEWAKLRLSFKKMHLFEKQIKALGVTHVIGGFVKILETYSIERHRKNRGKENGDCRSQRSLQVPIQITLFDFIWDPENERLILIFSELFGV